MAVISWLVALHPPFSFKRALQLWTPTLRRNVYFLFHRAIREWLGEIATIAVIVLIHPFPFHRFLPTLSLFPCISPLFIVRLIIVISTSFRLFFSLSSMEEILLLIISRNDERLLHNDTPDVETYYVFRLRSKSQHRDIRTSFLTARPSTEPERVGRMQNNCDDDDNDVVYKDIVIVGKYRFLKILNSLF